MSPCVASQLFWAPDVVAYSRLMGTGRRRETLQALKAHRRCVNLHPAIAAPQT